MKALVVLVLLAGTASADGKLGWRIGGLRVPVGDHELATLALGIGVEHAVHHDLRVWGEYDWLWVNGGAMGSPAFTGSGHHTALGIRHTLLAKTVLGGLRFYLDGELGGGVALASEDPFGTVLVPHATAGLRGGYAVRGWEPELLVRAIVAEHGTGVQVGFGMMWGD